MFSSLESQLLGELKLVRHQIVSARQRGACRGSEWAATIDRITAAVDGAEGAVMADTTNELEMWGDEGRPVIG